MLSKISPETELLAYKYAEIGGYNSNASKAVRNQLMHALKEVNGLTHSQLAEMTGLTQQSVTKILKEKTSGSRLACM